jgi:hypothetical protein
MISGPFRTGMPYISDGWRYNAAMLALKGLLSLRNSSVLSPEGTELLLFY